MKVALEKPIWIAHGVDRNWTPFMAPFATADLALAWVRSMLDLPPGADRMAIDHAYEEQGWKGLMIERLAEVEDGRDDQP